MKPLTIRPLTDAERTELHLGLRSPEAFTLRRCQYLLAAACHEQGWTGRALSGEAIRQALGRLGVSWRRAKHWLASPDPGYAAKKKPTTT